MPSIRAFALPALLVMSLGLAACGDDDEDTTTASTPTTAADTTPADTTAGDDGGSTGGDVAGVDAELQKRMTEYQEKWAKRSQELGTKLASDPSNAKAEATKFFDEFEKDTNDLLEDVKSSDLPDDAKKQFEDSSAQIKSAFEQIRTQLDQLPG
ncbi:MAG: hypothetical protein M0P31_03885 [Solirubrobacteraceae bacterium]|nr:hypothetical protein [Solirubrobacteraceae bacterium]